MAKAILLLTVLLLSGCDMPRHSSGNNRYHIKHYWNNDGGYHAYEADEMRLDGNCVKWWNRDPNGGSPAVPLGIACGNVIVERRWGARE